MEFYTALFFYISITLIFASSVSEYLALNFYSNKNIFLNNIKNKDFIASRIYGEVKDENSIFYLNPYMWSLVAIAVVGDFVYFTESRLFNVLAGLMLLYFLVQYFILILKVRKRTYKGDTHQDIINKVEEMRWEFKTKKIPLKRLSLETKKTLELDSFDSKDGDIEFHEFIDLKKDKVLGEFKYEDDTLFVDKGLNKYEVYFKKGKPVLRKITISISPIFTEINKPIDINKKMTLSLIEAFVTSFVLYLTLIGVSIF